MISRAFKTCLVLVVANLAQDVQTSGNCKTKHSKITVTSSRNATGHLLATLRLDQKRTQGRTTGHTVVGIEPLTTKCEGVRTDSLVVTIEEPGVFPNPGYDYLPAFGYYKLHEEKVLWSEAKAACEKENAHLLVLNSEAEANAVHQIVKRYPDEQWIHVGFHDTVKEGNYITVFGETVADAGYSRWDAGQPDDYKNNEDCGSIRPLTMGLNDLICTARVRFICEQNI